MNNSPIITAALIQSRQRDLLEDARRARLAREVRQANRGERDTAPAPERALRRTPGRTPWQGWQLGLAGLFGAH
jgi:hypothetical protein